MTVPVFKDVAGQVIAFISTEMETNKQVLNEMAALPENVTVLIKEDEKFSTYLKGMKVLFQMVENYRCSVKMVSKLETENMLDFETFLQELQVIKVLKSEILDILENKLKISD